jgi:hypothetical protein
MILTWKWKKTDGLAMARGRGVDGQRGSGGDILGRECWEFRKTRHPRNVEFNKVLETCFSGAENSRFSEAWSLRSLKSAKRAKFGNLDSVKKWGDEHAEARNPELSMARTSENGRFGNLSRIKFGSQARGHARTSGEAKANSGNC